MNRSIAALGMVALLTSFAAAPLAIAEDVRFLTKQQDGEVAVVRMAGTPVLNNKGDQVGKLIDLVLDGEGRAKAIVIGVGGFLGLGSKNVAVPYSAVRLGPVVEGARVLVLNASPAQLKAAAAYVATEPGRTERAKKKAGDWLKVAKDKALELSKQAGDAVQNVREQMTQPDQAKSKEANQ